MSFSDPGNVESRNLAAVQPATGEVSGAPLIQPTTEDVEKAGAMAVINTSSASHALDEPPRSTIATAIGFNLY